MKRIFLLFTLSIAFFTINAQDAPKVPTVDGILETYFEAIGGVDKWKALKSHKMELKISQMGMEIPGVMYSKRPNKKRLEINIQGKTMLQVFDGETAWWINPFSGSTDAQVMPAGMGESFSSEDFEDAFIDYKEKGHAVEYLGDKEIDGVKCHELKMTKKDGTETFHYFDPEYMVPIMYKSTDKSGPAAGQLSETYISGYEEFNGLIIPTSIETRVNGQVQMMMTMTKIELNVEVEDSFFAFPKPVVEEAPVMEKVEEVPVIKN